MGDAVDDDVIAGGRSHPNSSYVDELGLDTLDLHRVNPVDESAGEGVLHSEQNANLLQVLSFAGRL